MQLYDRYISKIVSDKDLPENIDFGRYCLIDNNSISELTYSNFHTNKLIKQELLLDKNKSLQDVFVDINIDIEKSKPDSFDVVPLIRRIKNKLGLNEFERLLIEKIFHIEEIFRQPHYMLDREIEKVNVSRAKRIPAKSYQYLASHTEDWIHKSIVSFKPSRILNEELEINFDIYENQISITLVERCLVYLNSRLKEIQDIKSFLIEYEKLLGNRKDDRGWYKKIERNLRLIGVVYEDENYNSKSNDGSILSKTEEVLNQLNKRLLLLRSSELFDVVNKRVGKTISLRNTNVLVNHKHYRYVKTLWVELEKVKPEKSDNEKVEFEQSVYNGVVSYGRSLIAYVLKDYLDYEIIGTYQTLNCKHLFYPGLTLSTERTGEIKITIDKTEIKLIIIANEPELEEKLTKHLLKDSTYIFYYSESTTLSNSHAVHINPIDPDSAERVASFIKGILLKNYVSKLNIKYPFSHSLLEYLHCFQIKFIEFNKTNFTFSYKTYPEYDLKYDDILKCLDSDSNFKNRITRMERDSLSKTVAQFVIETNKCSSILRNEFLYCFNCYEKQSIHTVSNLNYIKCAHCKTLLDITNLKSIRIKNTEPKYSELQQIDWGMDYIEIDLDKI